MNAGKLGALFGATRQDYVACTPLVWGPMGRALVDEVAPGAGHRVLDACCGAGASAIPAGRAVGESGTVDAVDLAAGLLTAGRERADAEGVGNVSFWEADVTSWQPPNGMPYDRVQCAYGVFFLPEMDTAAARLVGLLRSGGRFGVSVWRRGAIEEYSKAFYNIVERYKPNIADGQDQPNPITRINTRESLSQWFQGLGLTEVTVREVPGAVPSGQDFAWRFVLGSGLRGALDGLTPDQVRALRGDFLASLDEQDVRTVDTSTLVGTGVR
ncbi:class I SAM-dependent methyltransferase [Saccharopolyspora sp. 6V]|uniref:class I SAM-dependent methyltransferase n=1 Tax=Saccharopolyspora sp. 6V TaxID=2877239 RepID=UPI001CD4C0D7|nr:class I SAM-dependent methyltransferase [Saccharopolyspora sp. 6V]MCA1192863.1 class I SAM-dependent methyltransferase [Saccharopolyspora sp. 6V]